MKRSKRYRLYLDFATREELVEGVANLKAFGLLDSGLKLYRADGLDERKCHTAYVLSKDERLGGEVKR